MSGLPLGADAGPPVAYTVIYKDAKGREILPYYLRGTREDEPALQRFYRAHEEVPCSGGWVSPPCNDTPRLQGFPVPPVGQVTPR